MKARAIENVFIGKASRNTVSNVVAGTATLGRIWGDDVWMGYVDQNGGAAAMGGSRIGLTPTAVARMVELPFMAEEYESNETRASILRLRHSETELAVTAALGRRLADVTA